MRIFKNTKFIKIVSIIIIFMMSVFNVSANVNHQLEKPSIECDTMVHHNINNNEHKNHLTTINKHNCCDQNKIIDDSKDLCLKNNNCKNCDNCSASVVTSILFINSSISIDFMFGDINPNIYIFNKTQPPFFKEKIPPISIS